MSMIRVENLTFSYPSAFDNVFENVNFQIDTHWKLGFVGRNGRGKTTFLQLLMGRYEYQGTILSQVEFDYFPYPVPQGQQLTQEVLEQAAPQAQTWELMRELSYLEVGEEVLWRPFHTLSPGEQTKALLAALFLRPGHFLLIDEPTNHLDARARDILSRYLQKKSGFILVSHDRMFLDGCVDHILSINRSTIELRSGNYSSWQENFQRQLGYEQAQNQRLKKSIAAMEQAAKRTSTWSDQVEATKIGSGAVDRGYIGHKSAKMMKRAKSLEARQQRALEEKAALLKDQERQDTLKLYPQPYFAPVLAEFSQVVPMYDGEVVCPPVSFTLRRGDRVALSGGNGSGKSSLMKLLLGQPIQHQGQITLGSGLVVSYVPQDTGAVRGSAAAFAQENGLPEPLFKAMLAKLGLPPVQFGKDMAHFSAGQKKKVLLARSLCQKAHLYLWDEPLNYIDIDSRIQIENLLLEYAPTMVFVEHDRAFRQAVATQVVEVGISRKT